MNKVHRIRRGLDLPIAGTPEHVIRPSPPVARVALLAADYLGARPAPRVEIGDKVKRGQPLLTDENAPGVLFTAPGAGTVTAVHRDGTGELRSIVVALSEGERAGDVPGHERQRFSAYTAKPIPALSRGDVRALLLESGLWTAFRTRPFSRVPRADAVPDGIFINAMDTEPLAGKPEVVVAENAAAFDTGLAVIAKLREGYIWLCVAEGSSIKAGPYSGVSVERFAGPHPSGTVGLHIHTLYPAHRGRSVWHLGYQDVIRIGKLFTTGELDVEQIVAFGGPAVKSPRLLRTRLGASISELTAGEITPGDVRVISGSVLSGRAVSGEAESFLGRYHQHVCALNEDHTREFLAWMRPRPNVFSSLNIFARRRAAAGKKFTFTTSTHGAARSLLPIGVYERVMPMGLLPTPLLSALIAGDAARAERLGCLELDEEDLALCSFVCPGKQDYGPRLREVLTQLERKG